MWPCGQLQTCCTGPEYVDMQVKKGKQTWAGVWFNSRMSGQWQSRAESLSSYNYPHLETGGKIPQDCTHFEKHPSFMKECGSSLQEISTKLCTGEQHMTESSHCMAVTDNPTHNIIQHVRRWVNRLNHLSLPVSLSLTRARSLIHTNTPLLWKLSGVQTSPFTYMT